MARRWPAFITGWIFVLITKQTWQAAVKRWFKPVVFLAALTPALLMLERTINNRLGANPIEALIRGLGDDAITFIMIALAVTPLRRLSGWVEVVKVRRMLGLFAFFYAMLHLLAYIGLDQQFDWHDIGVDIWKRRYITIGMAVIVILTALAVTSPKAVVRAMGGKRWKALHRWVYLAGAGAVIHYYLMVKADTRPPLLYGAVLLVLLLLRLPKPSPMLWQRLKQSGRIGKV